MVTTPDGIVYFPDLTLHNIGIALCLLVLLGPLILLILAVLIEALTDPVCLVMIGASGLLIWLLTH